MQLFELQQKAILLLKNLIETPSFSKEEDKTAKLLEEWFQKRSEERRVGKECER